MTATNVKRSRTQQGQDARMPGNLKRLRPILARIARHPHDDLSLSARAGAPWEIYVTDPAEVADPARWRTDVFWPLAR